MHVQDLIMFSCFIFLLLQMEEKISKFCKDDKATKLECDTMTKVERSTV